MLVAPIVRALSLKTPRSQAELSRLFLSFSECRYCEHLWKGLVKGLSDESSVGESKPTFGGIGFHSSGISLLEWECSANLGLDECALLLDLSESC